MSQTMHRVTANTSHLARGPPPLRDLCPVQVSLPPTNEDINLGIPRITTDTGSLSPVAKWDNSPTSVRAVTRLNAQAPGEARPVVEEACSVERETRSTASMPRRPRMNAPSRHRPPRRNTGTISTPLASRNAFGIGAPGASVWTTAACSCCGELLACHVRAVDAARQ